MGPRKGQGRGRGPPSRGIKKEEGSRELGLLTLDPPTMATRTDATSLLYSPSPAMRPTPSPNSASPRGKSGNHSSSRLFPGQDRLVEREIRRGTCGGHVAAELLEGKARLLKLEERKEKKVKPGKPGAYVLEDL